MANIDVLDANSLTPRHVAAWREIQQDDSRFDSAFYSPKFTQLVAATRGGVEVAIISEQDKPVGFFPFQRGSGDVAQSVVGRLSEFHGVIAREGATWSPEAIMRASGLKAWHFDHVRASHTAFESHAWGTSDSPYIDLSAGFDAYCGAQHTSGSRQIKQAQRKRRKLEREIGPLRFEFESIDLGVLRSLIEWKTQQHCRTGMLEVLRIPWVVELLRTLVDSPKIGCWGALSALYAGEELLAVHLGVRNPKTLHIWFPTFNRDFEAYSPGVILILELAKAAAADGVERIDLGKGPERYKQSLKSGSIPLLEGSVDLRPAHRLVRRNWYELKTRIRSSPNRHYLEAPLLWTQKMRQRLAFR